MLCACRWVSVCKAACSMPSFKWCLIINWLKYSLHGDISSNVCACTAAPYKQPLPLAEPKPWPPWPCSGAHDAHIRRNSSGRQLSAQINIYLILCPSLPCPDGDGDRSSHSYLFVTGHCGPGLQSIPSYVVVNIHLFATRQRQRQQGELPKMDD